MSSTLSFRIKDASKLNALALSLKYHRLDMYGKYELRGAGASYQIRLSKW